MCPRGERRAAWPSARKQGGMSSGAGGCSGLASVFEEQNIGVWRSKGSARLTEESLTAGRLGHRRFLSPLEPSPALSQTTLPHPCRGRQQPVSQRGSLSHPGSCSNAAFGHACRCAACRGEPSSRIRPLSPTFQTSGLNARLRNSWCWIPTNAKNAGAAAFLDVASLSSTALHRRFASVYAQRQKSLFLLP